MLTKTRGDLTVVVSEIVTEFGPLREMESGSHGIG